MIMMVLIIIVTLLIIQLRIAMIDEEIKLINKVLNCSQYCAEQKLNEGSYGEIYRVYHQQSNKMYALKALETSKLQKMKKMHEAIIEIIVLKKLNLPGVVKLFDVIKQQNYIGLVMELCPFGDLFMLMKHINRNMTLLKKKNKIVVYYLAQILETLDNLHDKKIIHRDIKPENIVIGPDLKIRIIDFGTAKVIGNNFLTESEQMEINKVREDEQVSSPTRKSLVGSANYLSPEALKMNYSQKSDIWALGVIAYKFYHNHLPFQGENNFQIFKKIVQNQIILDNKIQPDYKQFIILCLKKQQNERASAKMLKMCSLFKLINFKEIFSTEPPIFREQLNDKVEDQSQFLFELSLQKKMFFGNFKPRLLTISKYEDRLWMAYRYLPSKRIKHQFELNMNDFAQPTKNTEFEVSTIDKRYQFRVGKGMEVQEVVEMINKVIKTFYKLE